MTNTLLATLVLCAAIASPLAAQMDNATTRRSLAGLGGVGVLVEDIDDDAQRHGLERNQVTTDVELRIRQAGIPVLTREESLAAPGSPYLYVVVGTVGTQEASVPLYAASLRIELVQWVRLGRKPTVEVPAVTWNAQAWIAVLGENKLGEAVRDAIRDHTDRFINAYLAANPTR